MLKKFFCITALLAVTANVSATELEMASLAPQAITFEAVAPEAAPAAVVSAKSYAAQAFAYMQGKKQSCADFLSKTAGSIVGSCSQANNSVNEKVLARMPWFKNHANALTASKVAVATAVVAVTAYVLKKAYNKVQSYRAAKAAAAQPAQK